MILSAPQIKEIVKSPSPKFISDATEYSKKMRLHLNGVDKDQHIFQIEGFERLNIRDLRTKYAKSNRDIFARLSRPLDRIFSAKGGSIYANLPEAQETRAMILSSNVRNGVSIKKWLETVWMPHMNDDPNGVIFMEILPAAEARLAISQGRSATYPTYKSITAIHNYAINGNRLEWIVFKVTDENEKVAAGVNKNVSLYRLVDDAFDYYVKIEGNEAIIVDNQTMPNFFGRVPAVLNSDIVNPENENNRLAFFHNAIELADHYFLKNSIKITHDFLHGFPKYSEFADDCYECNGTGYKESEKCTGCSGSGKKAMTRVSDIKLLQYPTKEDQLIKPSEVGGYVSPDKTFHEISTSDLFDLENAMNVTIWGTESKLRKVGVSGASTDGNEKTATQVVSEVRPEADRLHIVSEMAEHRHKFIFDAVVTINIKQNYGGSSVSYGRRYMLESTDSIWMRYMEARKTGAPQSVLDDMLNEYYDAKFMTDPIALRISKKLMYVEPFVHYTAEQVQKLNTDPADYKAKLYYGEWLAQQTDSLLLVTDAETLKASLAAFVSTKALPAPAAPAPVA